MKLCGHEKGARKTAKKKRDATSLHIYCPGIHRDTALTATAEPKLQSGTERDGSSSFSAASPRSESVVPSGTEPEGSTEMSTKWRFCAGRVLRDEIGGAGTKTHCFEAFSQSLLKDTLKLDENLANPVGRLPRWAVRLCARLFVCGRGRDEVVQRRPP